MCNASPLAPGAIFAVADSAALDSDTHHDDVAVAMAGSSEGDDSVLVAAGGGWGSAVVNVNGSASYPLTLSMECKSAGKEFDVINTSLRHGRVSQIDVYHLVLGTNRKSHGQNSGSFEFFWK